MAEITETELIDRDTKILVYDVVGHDGSDPHDTCSRCGIVLLREYSGIPDKWGDHQTAVGNVCKQCFREMFHKNGHEIRMILSNGCWNCREENCRIFFYQGHYPGAGEVYPYKAVPVCSACEEKLHEKKNIVTAISDYHYRLGRHASELFRSCKQY